MHNPLNDADIDGNTLNLNKEDGISHEDEYLCASCKTIVKASIWHWGYKCCMSCFSEHMEDVNSKHREV